MVPGGTHLGTQVSALLDGQLTIEQADRAWRHVAGCEACRKAVRREDWVKRRLSGLAEGEPPFGPPVGLRAALSSLPAQPTLDARWCPPARRRGGTRLAVTAVGVGSLSAALIVLGAGYLTESPPGTDDPAPSGLLPSDTVVADLPTGLPSSDRWAATHRGSRPWARMEP